MPLPLKIGILSFTRLEKKPNPSDLLLKKTAVAMGHRARIFRNARFQFEFGGLTPQLFYKSAPFSKPDVMIVRPTVFNNVDLETSTIKQLQLMGIPVLNRYLPIIRSKNKVRTLQILNHHNIPLPRTAVLHSLEYLDDAIARIGKFPVIMKTPQGSQGLGVSILESSRSLKSMVDMLLLNTQFKNSLLIIQEYVKEAKGKDIRVFIVGGKIVAAMERKAKKGDFRSNFHRGGSIAVADLAPEEKKIALKAAEVIGLDIAGVDIIRTSEGSKVLEVNSNPGLEGITKATGINVASHIIRLAEKKAKRKEWLLEKEDMLTAA